VTIGILSGNAIHKSQGPTKVKKNNIRLRNIPTGPCREEGGEEGVHVFPLPVENPVASTGRGGLKFRQNEARRTIKGEKARRKRLVEGGGGKKGRGHVKRDQE